MVAMNNSSSRVLRAEEHSGVTPVSWRTSSAPFRPTSTSANPGRDGISTEAADTAKGPDADKEREGIEREAYQRGFLAGQAAGREQGRAEVQPLLDQMGRSLATLAGMRSNLRSDAEKDLVKLAVAIARRVLHRELTLDPGSIEGLIRVALEKLEARELCRVRVHPDQEAAIRNSLERFSNSQKVELIADSSMQCGDVLFETTHGDLNGSIEAQLQEIERGLADRLQRVPHNR
jgi:flagellar assembly protein FliH